MLNEHWKFCAKLLNYSQETAVFVAGACSQPHALQCWLATCIIRTLHIQFQPFLYTYSPWLPTKDSLWTPVRAKSQDTIIDSRFPLAMCFRQTEFLVPPLRTEIQKDKSVVFLAGAALDPLSSQRGRNYNGNIYCMTPAQYGRRYITWHPDNKPTLR